MSNPNNPVDWFEIPVTDLTRAIDFYTHVFDVNLQARPFGGLQMAFFPMQNDAYGATGALVLGEHRKPSEDGTLIYFSTADITTTLSRAEEKGGKTLKAKTSIGQYGYVGVMRDSEGNRIGLHTLP